MNPEPSPYDAAIADIESQMEKLQITLDTLRQLRGRSEGAALPLISGSRHGEAGVQHDTFFGMTIGEAARKYLAMTKATQSTADIAAALEQGGLKHSSKDFPTTIRSILGPREDFVRVPNGDWGLAEWYPAMARAKKARPEKPAKAKPVAQKEEKAANGTAVTGEKSLRQRILEVIKTDPQKGWLASEIAAQLNASRKKVATMMWVMTTRHQELSKADAGYRLAA